MGNEILIGEKLRQARLKKNISIDELQQKTKIQKRYLEAIEKGAFEDLPGAYYVRTFLRQYAQVVGLDGNFLVDVYEGNDSFEPITERPRPEVVKGSRKALHEENPRIKKTKDYLPMILLGLIALMIIGVIAYITWQENHSDPIIGQTATSVSVTSQTRLSTQKTTEKKETKASKKETKASKKKTMKITVDSSSSSQATVTIKQAEKPLKLKLTGKNDRCWVGVTVNGSSIFEQTLTAGETQEVSLPEETKQAVVILGASQNVDLEANDQAVDFQTTDKSVLQKTLTFNISYQN